MNRLATTGTRALVGLSFRRDRLLLTLWTLLLVTMSYVSAAATGALYPTFADQVTAAHAINASPAIVALYGPILDPTSLGELAMTKMTVLYAVFVAALFVVVVRRHTRGEEESGRTELAVGTAVGRHAPLLAALAEAALVAVGVGALTAAANVLGGLPPTGSVAFGAAWAGIGLVGAGVSAVACQLSASTRTCGAFASGALAAAYLLRAAGDARGSWLSWLSPFGWGTRLRAYSDPRWWVLVLYLTTFGAMAVLSVALRARRDLGAGLVPDRHGPGTAPRWLRGPSSLALRTHAATLAVWTVASATMGGVLGAIVPNVSDLLSTESARAMMARIGGEGAVERTLIGAELSMMAVAVACFGIATFTHAAGDEEGGRSAVVLATATSRDRSFLAVAATAAAGVSWLLLVAGTAIATGYVIAGGAQCAFSEIVAAALAQAPAAGVAVAAGAVAFAVRATWTFLGWVALAAFVTLGQVGELLSLPAWAIGISPFTHTPALPAESFEIRPVLGLAAVATGLLAASWVGYRRRDVL